MSPVLQTERLVLRPPVAADWDGFRTFAMSDRALGIGGPYPERTAWRVFCAELGHWALLGYGMWAVTRKGDDRALGLIGPWTPADWPEKEVGWTVWREEDEGTGIATEAARAAVDHAYHELGWETVVSYVGTDNMRSAALAEKLGAVLDPDAPQPKPDEPCMVYRHPKPEDQ